MKLNKLLIVGLVILAIFTIGAVSATDDNGTADELTISENFEKESSVDMSEGYLGDSSGKTFQSLADLIENTSSGDILELDDNYYNDGSSKEIVISKEITIDGKGHTLDVNNKSCTFYIFSANVTLKNIVFKNGFKDYTVDLLYGGTVSNCSFIDCYSWCIYVSYFSECETDAVISNCNFINCSKGALCIYNNTIISNCKFVNCSAEYNRGIILGSANKTLLNSSFINCLNDNDGYAIYWSSNGVISNCNFINCFSTFNHGVVYWKDGNANISHCNFIADMPNNRSTSDFISLFCNGGSISDCNFEKVNNPLRWVGNDNKVFNCTFLNNMAVYLKGDNNNISYCNFRNCFYFDGGAVYWGGDYGYMSNCNFENCTSQSGGAINWNGNNGTINNCDFKNCSTTNSRLMGGAIRWIGGDGSISNCYFVNCSANWGGAICFGHDYIPYGPVYTMDCDNNILDNCNFVNCSANYFGGAICFGVSDNVNYEQDCDNVIVNNSNFINCSSKGDGGAICFESYPIPNLFNIESIFSCDNSTVNNCNFVDCFAGNFISAGADGGAIFLSGSNAISNSNFTNCHADRFGGSILIPLESTIVNCSFIYPIFDNYAVFSYLDGTIIDSNFVNCQCFFPKLINIVANNLNVMYSTGKTYSITVLDKGMAAQYENVGISVNDGKEFIYLKTNSKGIASFKVTQKPGKYKLNIDVWGVSVTRTITVKHLVTLKTVKVKKSAKKLVLQASLGKVNGKYLKGKTITFKFNGKNVGKVKTNAKGIAKATVKSSVLKKLKVGKKVSYQATYIKDTVKKTAKIYK